MNISENARVWIYQSDRSFTTDEANQISQLLEGFVGEWVAHGNKLAAAAEIRYNRFIILAVDESIAGATGCSIDKSVNLMKQLENDFGVNLFDRFNIAYRDGNEILSCGREAFETLLQNGQVSSETIVFNNLVQSVKELNSNWEIALKNSWHARVFGNLVLTLNV